MKFYFDNYKNIVSNANFTRAVTMIDSTGTEYILDKNLTISMINIDFAKKYYIVVNNYKYEIEYRYIVKTKKFEYEFSFSGKLGANYKNNVTIFRLWAPTSYSVNLIDFENREKYEMTRSKEGVFELELAGDMHGFKYLYEIEQKEKFLAIDPYATCTGPNRSYSVVVDFSRFDKVTCLEQKQLKDLALYEMHVRDFTCNEYFKNKGNFLGLIEKNLTNKNGEAIGFDYVINLGISHIQLLPIYDFSSVNDEDENYNWGYDPAQYSCLKPLYGSDLDDDFSPIRDFIQVVNTYHENGIGVNMDVVYNHVHDSEKFILNKIVPHYFNRLNDDYTNSNGSFCGNDFESNTSMGRKFIVDSLLSLQKNFGFDGFRFDLMGIIDTTTLNEAAKALKIHNPNILLYGEGWDMPTQLDEGLKGTMFNYEKIQDYAFFNDKFRDGVRGGMQDLNKHGLVGGKDLELINTLINGTDFLRPSQSINYVSCHDNHTLYDRLRINYDQDLKNRIKFAYSLVILSSGIPFLHAGCEFMRTKNGVENSYISGYEINTIDWDQLTKHHDLVDFVKTLLQLRKSNNYFNIDDYEKLNHQIDINKLKITNKELSPETIEYLISELS